MIEFLIIAALAAIICAIGQIWERIITPFPDPKKSPGEHQNNDPFGDYSSKENIEEPEKEEYEEYNVILGTLLGEITMNETPLRKSDALLLVYTLINSSSYAWVEHIKTKRRIFESYNPNPSEK
jgi:hypothetical protein